MSYTYCSGFNLSNLSHIQTARTDNCQTHKSGQLVRTNRSGYANRPDTRAACGDKFGVRKSSGHINQGSFSGQIVQGMQIVWTHTNPGRLVRTNSGHANRPDTIRTHTQIRAACPDKSLGRRAHKSSGQINTSRYMILWTNKSGQIFVRTTKSRQMGQESSQKINPGKYLSGYNVGALRAHKSKLSG